MSPDVAELKIRYAIAPDSVMQEEKGFFSVYTTGVQGIGVSIYNSSQFGRIPFIYDKKMKVHGPLCP